MKRAAGSGSASDDADDFEWEDDTALETLFSDEPRAPPKMSPMSAQQQLGLPWYWAHEPTKAQRIELRVLVLCAYLWSRPRKLDA